MHGRTIGLLTKCTMQMIIRSYVAGSRESVKLSEKFWSQIPSRLEIPRENQCAERAIKCL